MNWKLGFYRLLDKEVGVLGSVKKLDASSVSMSIQGQGHPCKCFGFLESAI